MIYLIVDYLFLQCDIPLELLKAAVLLRKLLASDATTPKPLESERDGVKASLPLKSERDIDYEVVGSLASVCRHWCTTMKKRSVISRRQLCLLLHG